MTIRPESPDDAPAIAALTERAFLNAPHTSHTEHLIVDALRRSGQLAVSLVAVDDTTGDLVGHVALSPVTISDGSTGWFGLGPISVEPDRQRAGIGTRLMRSSLGQLIARGASGCVLVGDPAFYTRFGFVADGRLIVPGIPTQYVLSLPLDDSSPRGTVAFHESFQVTDSGGKSPLS
jgi:predicted N-acetyltransferase YhbS